MSQTKNKTTPFVKCEKCSTIVLKKDTENHNTNSCPPNSLNVVPSNCIIEECLYGSLDIKTNEDIKSLSSKDIENLVFLSQSVIQLCKFSIGEKVLISNVLNNKSLPVVKTVWPTSEKSLTSVLFTQTCLDTTFTETGIIVKVAKLPPNIPNSSQIIVVLLNPPKSLDVTPELTIRISKTFCNSIVTVGNKLNIWFYGRNLKLEIRSIQEIDSDASSIENGLKLLTLREKHQFYAVTENTKWVIYRTHETYAAKEAKTNQHTIAGLDEECDEIRESMCSAIGKTNNQNLRSSRCVLLYGHSGTGKTTLAHNLALESKASVISLCASDLYSKYSGSADEIIKNLFDSAIEQAPTVMVIDEIDLLCPSRSNRLTDAEKRIVSTIIFMIDNLQKLQSCRVFIIATTNKLDNIDAALRRSGRLDSEIEIPTPNPKSRKAILKLFLKDSDLSEEDFQEIALNTHGYVGADLLSLANRAQMNANCRSCSANVCLDDLKMAMKKVRPSAMREVQIEVPNVKWNDIGGQDNLKLILRQAVEWPLKHPESFIRLGVTPPRGVLMFGPPGCSKTMIAKALATESGLNFLSIKGPELFSKWVGDSEKAIRDVFRKARQVAPSIVFFDELDALGGERSSGSSTSVQERVLAQLLTELDGVTPLGDVTILAATNRPDKIDKALLRPGRLDRIVYVPLPDENTRREIFRIKFAKMPTDNVFIDALVEKTNGYSGAEVNAICQEAAMMALEENLDIQTISKRHFEKALALITPRTPNSLINLYEGYINTRI